MAHSQPPIKLTLQCMSSSNSFNKLLWTRHSLLSVNDCLSISLYIRVSLQFENSIQLD